MHSYRSVSRYPLRDTMTSRVAPTKPAPSIALKHYATPYIDVAQQLEDALKDYDGEDTAGALINIRVELPKLLDRRARAVAVFTNRGVTDLQDQVDLCVQLLEDLKTLADFINKLRMFYEMLGLLEHRPEVPGDVFRDAKLLGFINKVAANLYRDPALNLFGVAEKVKALINAHISARGVKPKIPPTAITDAEFEKVLQAQTSNRARAAQMQHAARYHIIGFSNQNPAFASGCRFAKSFRCFLDITRIFWQNARLWASRMFPFWEMVVQQRVKLWEPPGQSRGANK